MAITYPTPRHAIFSAVNDELLFPAGLRVRELQAVTNGTNGAFEILDGENGNRIAYSSGPGINADVRLQEDIEVAGIRIAALPTDGRVHLYYE